MPVIKLKPRVIAYNHEEDETYYFDDLADFLEFLNERDDVFSFESEGESDEQ